MQINKNINASILIWAIFISVIILISFFSISSKINKTINNYTENNLNYSLNEALKNLDFSNKDLWNREEIIFDDKKIYNKTLYYNQNTEVRVKGNIDTSFNFKINKWWPIFYNLLLFSGSTFSWSISKSWIVDNFLAFTWSLTWNYDNWIIYIKNLWWYTNFELNSSGALIKEYVDYKIVKDIGSKKVVKTQWNIKIFNIWDFSWVDYKKYGFNFSN